MKAILDIKINLRETTLNLKKGNRIYVEKVEKAEDLLLGLDKILKKSKIKFIDIGKIKVDNFNKSRYTSFRIVKSIEKALKFKTRELL
jgi:hydrogenase maturation factor HypF (carbamoyltransferase family)